MPLDGVALAAGFVAVAFLIASLGIVPYVAGQKGRSGVGWALLSLVVTPVIALLALAALPTFAEARDRVVPCPYCAESVRTEARVCPHCRSSLDSKLLERLAPRK